MGAGGPDLPNRLIDAVGPQGRVLATDIDTSWAKDGVEILRYDVATEPPCLGAETAARDIVGRDDQAFAAA